jgi:transcriptional regulator with XRE-family HTH domain
MSSNSTVHPVLLQLGEEISNWDNGLRTLETETGVSKSTLSRIARNRNASFDVICQVAAAFGYDVKLTRRIARQPTRA